MSVRDQALRIGADQGWVCVPLYRGQGGKWVPPYEYAELLQMSFDPALWERLWEGHDDARGLGAIWPRDVVELEADSDEATEWLRRRRLPRTPTFDSTRGPHYLFRSAGFALNPSPHPKVEVLSFEGGKRLLVLPPTPGKTWKPSLGLSEVPLVIVPDWTKATTGSPATRKTRIRLGPELPAGEAHREMVRIVGKLAPMLSPDELMTTAAALNQGRLPTAELEQIVTDIWAKEHREPREAAGRA